MHKMMMGENRCCTVMLSICWLTAACLLLFQTTTTIAVAQEEMIKGSLIIDGSREIAVTDDHYVCATIDWWPHTKCNYHQYPWGHSSAMNLNLSHPLLAKAIKAFPNLRIRIGGSLEDQVVYDVPGLGIPCHPFRSQEDGLFGFSHGCLHMERWDALNHLFHKTGAIVTFGLNALYGRKKSRNQRWIGPWNPSNAREFIKYTVSKGYHIDSWEFGNELSGDGVAAKVDVAQYGKDLIKLKAIINELYDKKEKKKKPVLLAPGGFYDKEWFSKLLKFTGPDVLGGLTHHIYNLGSGAAPDLVNKITNPDFLSKVCATFSDLQQNIRTNGPWSSAWVGEAGGAFNSGAQHVSNTFVDSFWYLDQLGMAATYDTKVYCRQSLTGGHYGLLNRTSFVPNPDYYSALLWHRLMGKKVLGVDRNLLLPHGLRSYAHCTKGRAGVTLLLINLSKRSIILDIHNSINKNINAGTDDVNKQASSVIHGLRKTVSWVGSKTSDGKYQREEYHLTPKHGYLQSQTMLLNGKPLQVSDLGDIPRLDPVFVNVKAPLYVSPLSIAFIVLPYFEAAACSH